MIKSKEVKETYNVIVENLQTFRLENSYADDILEEYYKQNSKTDYSVYSELSLYGKILKKFKLKEERLMALIMLYVVNASIYELRNWKLGDLEDYICDTVDEEYIEEYNKLFKIIERGL